MGPLMGGTIVCAIISVIVAVVAVIADNVNMGAFGEFMVNYSYYFSYSYCALYDFVALLR
ncbi:MAG: hypothetical protein L6V88_01030 [Anaerotruncus sp.]|nr:MAG: hypothetical protein L6V88_01030 [Anaerotruncus sp.]